MRGADALAYKCRSRGRSHDHCLVRDTLARNRRSSPRFDGWVYGADVSAPPLPARSTEHRTQISASALRAAAVVDDGAGRIRQTDVDTGR